MNLGEAVRYVSNALQSVYEEDERTNIAYLLVEECTGFDRSKIRLNKAEPLTPVQAETLDQFLPRLQQHEPVQYVLNKSWFYGMELYVDRNVLIPRPETEELVDWIVSDARAKGLDVFAPNPLQSDETNSLKILDIGTGSGCIALALKKAMPKAEVWGCDVSEEALTVARRNSATLDLRVDFQGLNFLDEARQSALPKVDVLVSNPPYVPLSDKETMRPNVLDFEPHTALFVPDSDALLFYKAIAAFAQKNLSAGGTIYLEIHEALADAVVELFKMQGFSQVTVRKDMQGKNRMVKACC